MMGFGLALQSLGSRSAFQSKIRLSINGLALPAPREDLRVAWAPVLDVGNATKTAFCLADAF
jgi:hypothetical protein